MQTTSKMMVINIHMRADFPLKLHWLREYKKSRRLIFQDKRCAHGRQKTFNSALRIGARIAPIRRGTYLLPTVAPGDVRCFSSCPGKQPRFRRRPAGRYCPANPVRRTKAIRKGRLSHPFRRAAMDPHPNYSQVATGPHCACWWLSCACNSCGRKKSPLRKGLNLLAFRAPRGKTV